MSEDTCLSPEPDLHISLLVKTLDTENITDCVSHEILHQSKLRINRGEYFFVVFYTECVDLIKYINSLKKELSFNCQSNSNSFHGLTTIKVIYNLNIHSLAPYSDHQYKTREY